MDSVLYTSPIAAQVVDAIAGTQPEGMIFIAINKKGVSYGMYGNVTDQRLAAKYLMRVISDIKNEAT